LPRAQSDGERGARVNLSSHLVLAGESRHRHPPLARIDRLSPVGPENCRVEVRSRIPRVDPHPFVEEAERLTHALPLVHQKADVPGKRAGLRPHPRLALLQRPRRRPAVRRSCENGSEKPPPSENPDDRWKKTPAHRAAAGYPNWNPVLTSE